jgi:hypothetical protein
LSKLKELDAESHALMEQLTKQTKICLGDRTILSELTQSYGNGLDFARQKVDLANKTLDLVDRHLQRMDFDLSKFEEEQITGPKEEPPSPEPIVVDKKEKSDEQTYCICGEVSHGEMIAVCFDNLVR